MAKQTLRGMIDSGQLNVQAATPPWVAKKKGAEEEEQPEKKKGFPPKGEEEEDPEADMDEMRRTMEEDKQGFSEEEDEEEEPLEEEPEEDELDDEDDSVGEEEDPEDLKQAFEEGKKGEEEFEEEEGEEGAMGEDAFAPGKPGQQAQPMQPQQPGMPMPAQPGPGVPGLPQMYPQPDAGQVANTLGNPAAAVVSTFTNLTQKKMDYEVAKEQAKAMLAPAKAIIQHAETTYGLSPDAEQGYREPGMTPQNPAWMGTPSQAADIPTESPGLPKLDPGAPMGGAPNLPGVPQKPAFPGAGPKSVAAPEQKPGFPPKAPKKMQSAAKPRGLAAMEASAAHQRLFAGGPGSGCRGDNCGRPKGSGGGSEKANTIKRDAGGNRLVGNRPTLNALKTHLTNTGYKLAQTSKGTTGAQSKYRYEETWVKGGNRVTVLHHPVGTTAGKSSWYTAVGPKSVLNGFKGSKKESSGEGKTSTGKMTIKGYQKAASLKLNTLAQKTERAAERGKAGDQRSSFNWGKAGYDREQYKMLLKDAYDFKSIANAVKTGDYRGADKILRRMDTEPRDQAFRALGNKFYKAWAATDPKGFLKNRSFSNDFADRLEDKLRG